MLKRETLLLKSIDGVQLNAQLDCDDMIHAKGIFILLHGCPSYRDEYGFYGYPADAEKVGMSEFFAQKGYPTLRFDFRSQHKDVVPEEMDLLSLHGMINDIESAYLYMVNKYIGAPIYIVATSFAGALTVLWKNIFCHSLKHIFFMCPLLELKDTLRKNDVLIRNENDTEILKNDLVNKLNEEGFFIAGGKKITREFFNEIMATNMPLEFKKMETPSTIFHGDCDISVDIERSKEYCLFNNSTKLIVKKDAVHGFGPRKDLGYTTEERTKIKYGTWQKIYSEMEEIIGE